MLVPRRVRKATDREAVPAANPPADLQEFRSLSAWVLLGEPGAGKSAAFSMEAEATNGKNLRIDEFINADPEEDWHGKTLFLDGLDETRAGRGDGTIQRIRRQLKCLGNPPFRIACRAADWYGSTDREDLKEASPDGRIDVLLLEPLNNEDILAILRENHGINDPRKFIEKAERRGISGLLDNPQTLGLLAQAIRGGRWPSARHDTYRLACEKLAEEASKRHRDKERHHPPDLEKALAAAGQLCAVLLFANKAGIALDRERANENFPILDDYAPPDLEAAVQAIGSKLFRPAGEERVEPSHRSIAEYLAAHWLAHRIDSEGLPLRRVLNLLLGPDGGVVAGLRGLFGWLALHCRTARPRLIEADPLTVVVYGDVKPMTVAEKRLILDGFRREAERFSAFHWNAQSAHPFGALVDPELRNDFLAILQAPERDEASQSLTDCVLEILAQGEALHELATSVLDLVRDDTRWPRVRDSALGVWLGFKPDPQTVLALLDEVNEGRVPDLDDGLAVALLRHLYPDHLAPEMLLRYFHTPKNIKHMGSYDWFWTYEMPRDAPNVHLPALLDELVNRPELSSHDAYECVPGHMSSRLLARGIAIHGDGISDKRLFDWLGIGADQHGYIQREAEEQARIANWLSVRPARYKALLAICFRQCEQYEDFLYCVRTRTNRLHDATPPEDIGLWHLEQASHVGNDTVAHAHFDEAMSALTSGLGAAGLSLERLEAWCDTQPERKQWLEPRLSVKFLRREWRGLPRRNYASKDASKQSGAEAANCAGTCRRSGPVAPLPASCTSWLASG